MSLLGSHLSNANLKNKQKKSITCELSFIWDKMRTVVQETASQTSLRSCSKEQLGGRSVYIWFWWGGRTYNQEQVCLLVFARFLLVTSSSCQNFSAFVSKRGCKNWACKIISWKCLSEDLLCQLFPKHWMPHFCSVSWTPFKRSWKPATAVVHALILVEEDGKCQF